NHLIHVIIFKHKDPPWDYGVVTLILSKGILFVYVKITKIYKNRGIHHYDGVPRFFMLLGFVPASFYSFC
ncbi:hypothetical protein, partial [Filobacillus milosensis]|uniref:hypothetical protein n=1 Tax=Filobacillus milosensis TaxID=94137 RepID=UPI001E3E0BAB